ncbi:MAG: hypothetical protein HON90_15145 [Halobacteriovoraceae bacterium]|nr:hypothetical protein [Halobacteriovoraceae bacterium]
MIKNRSLTLIKVTLLSIAIIWGYQAQKTFKKIKYDFENTIDPETIFEENLRNSFVKSYKTLKVFAKNNILLDTSSQRVAYLNTLSQQETGFDYFFIVDPIKKNMLFSDLVKKKKDTKQNHFKKSLFKHLLSKKHSNNFDEGLVGVNLSALVKDKFFTSDRGHYFSIPLYKNKKKVHSYFIGFYNLDKTLTYHAKSMQVSDLKVSVISDAFSKSGRSLVTIKDLFENELDWGVRLSYLNHGADLSLLGKQIVMMFAFLLGLIFVLRSKNLVPVNVRGKDLLLQERTVELEKLQSELIASNLNYENYVNSIQDKEEAIVRNNDHISKRANVLKEREMELKEKLAEVERKDLWLNEERVSLFDLKEDLVQGKEELFQAENVLEQSKLSVTQQKIEFDQYNEQRKEFAEKQSAYDAKNKALLDFEQRLSVEENRLVDEQLEIKQIKEIMLNRQEQAEKKFSEITHKLHSFHQQLESVEKIFSTYSSTTAYKGDLFDNFFDEEYDYEKQVASIYTKLKESFRTNSEQLKELHQHVLKLTDENAEFGKVFYELNKKNDEFSSIRSELEVLCLNMKLKLDRDEVSPEAIEYIEALNQGFYKLQSFLDEVSKHEDCFNTDRINSQQKRVAQFRLQVLQLLKSEGQIAFDAESLAENAQQIFHHHSEGITDVKKVNQKLNDSLHDISQNYSQLELVTSLKILIKECNQLILDNDEKELEPLLKLVG